MLVVATLIISFFGWIFIIALLAVISMGLAVWMNR